MNKLLFLSSFILLIFLSETAICQDVIDTPIVNFIVYKTPKVYKPFVVNGRVLVVNLDDARGAIVVNACTAEKTIADSHGFYQIMAIKGDTLAFQLSKYSVAMQGVRSPNDNINIILFKRKSDSLPPGHSKSDYNKAKKEDDELYRILDKDAKQDGKWKY